MALNPDDGSYKWHFQNSPHDLWDYDGVNTPVLVDIEKDGKTIKALVQAHRNGYFYCLNRENGQFIYGKPFCEVNWTDRTKGVDGLHPKTGRPYVNPAALPSKEGAPGMPRGRRRQGMVPDGLSPGTGYAYVPVINNCAKFTSGKAFFIKGQPYWGSSLTLIENKASGALKAIDAATGEIKWDVATRSPMVAGVLTTGGGLVFTGDAEGFLTAYDAKSGKDLWHFQCGSDTTPRRSPTPSRAGNTSLSASGGVGGPPDSLEMEPPGCATPAAATRYSSSPCQIASWRSTHEPRSRPISQDYLARDYGDGRHRASAGDVRDGRSRAGCPVCCHGWRSRAGRGHLEARQGSGSALSQHGPGQSAVLRRQGRPARFDVEIARALAREMNVKLRLGWIDIHRETAIGEFARRRL